MFFNFFKSQKKKKVSRDEYWERRMAEQPTYRDEPDITIVRTKKDKDNVKANIMSLCEQMLTFSKESDAIKQEYKLVTSYLNDIQTIEGLTEEEKAPILNSAKEILKLRKAREDFLKLDKKLADVQFEQMREQEQEVPGAIERLKANDEFLKKVERDLKYLEGEKLHQALRKQDFEWEQKLLKRISVGSVILFVILLILIFILAEFLGEYVQLAFLGAAALTCILLVYVYVRFQNCEDEIRQCNVNRNYATTLENHAKIRYVHTKNAIDYVCEKYHVKNAMELEYMFQCYQEAVREQQKFENTNVELEFYNKELVKQLSALWLYDAKAWINHVDALIDAREMVEVKHKLLQRRQRIRGRLEESRQTIDEMKEEVAVNLRQMGELEKEIQEIINQLSEVNSKVS